MQLSARGYLASTKPRVQSPAHTKTMLSSSNGSDVYVRVGDCREADTARWQPVNWDNRPRRVRSSSPFLFFALHYLKITNKITWREYQTRWRPRLLCPWSIHMHIHIHAYRYHPCSHTYANTQCSLTAAQRVILSWHYCLTGETQAQSMNPYPNSKELREPMV